MTVTATRPQLSPDRFATRFHDRTARPDALGCRLWTGPTNQQGQPMTYDGDKTLPGRRYAWRLAYGEIPLGMAVTVTCGMAGCLTPEHLALTDLRPFMGRAKGHTRVDRYLQPAAGDRWVLTVFVDGRLVESSVHGATHAALVALLRAAQKYDQRG